MNNNPILDANLKLISKYNPELKYKVLQIKELQNDILVSNTCLQEPNLTYNGYPLHDNYGAETEAKNIFSKSENNPLLMHVIFGLGLGYLFQQFALNSKGVVILYEPNIEILASTLEIADFTNELGRKNVFVCSSYQEFEKCYRENYVSDSSTTISFLPSYKKLFGAELTSFAEKVNRLMGSIIIDENYIKYKLCKSVKSLCDNLDLLVNEPPITVFSDIYKDKTAIIVSAGPSLDKNIETIKKYRDKAIVFSVGQAIRTLIKNDIKPDFLVSIELYDTTYQIENLDLSDIDLIVEPITHSSIHKLNVKNTILYPSKTSVANLIWSQYANIDSSNCISSGTVSYTALYCAKLLGFKDIALVGQDLAYLGGRCYSSGTKNTKLSYKIDELTGKPKVYVDDLEVFKEAMYSSNANMSDEQKTISAKKYLDRINKNLVFVDGIKGDKLLTSTDYASFIDVFASFAKENSNINLYNTSLVGALIEGFKNESLDNILKYKESVQRLNLEVKFKYDLKDIIENIKIDKANLDLVLKSFKACGSLISSFEKEYNNRKILTDKSLNYFKQILSIYIDLKDKFLRKSRLFMYLQRPYEMLLDKVLKIYNSPDEENILIIFGNLKKYFVNTEKWINIIVEILQEKVEKLDEMLNSEG